MNAYPKVGLNSNHRGAAEEIVEAFIDDSCAIGPCPEWHVTEGWRTAFRPHFGNKAAWREKAAGLGQRQPRVL